ncbi:MAG TPA: CcmD family protein [Vicinamibacterales bacterium]
MRPRLTRLVLAALVALLPLSIPLHAGAQPAQPPAAQDEYVPIDEVPPEDQLPAAPLLIAAYIVAWLAVAGYVWSLWRRLGTVERELRLLQERTGGGRR